MVLKQSGIHMQKIYTSSHTSYLIKNIKLNGPKCRIQNYKNSEKKGENAHEFGLRREFLDTTLRT